MIITSLGNAGIHLKEERQSWLIDGLYGENEFFPTQSKAVVKELHEPGGMLRNTDYILFTHRHKDHLNVERVRAYLLYNAVRQIWIPKPEAEHSEYVDNGNLDVQYVTHLDEAEEQIFEVMQFHDATVSFLRTEHLGESKFKTSHYSIMLRIRNCILLVLADSDVVSTVKILERFSNKKITAVFINPVTGSDTRVLSALKNIIVQHIFIYHIPNEDRFGLIRSAECMWKKLNGTASVHVLAEELQKIYI